MLQLNKCLVSLVVHNFTFVSKSASLILWLRQFFFTQAVYLLPTLKIIQWILKLLLPNKSNTGFRCCTSWSGVRYVTREIIFFLNAGICSIGKPWIPVADDGSTYITSHWFFSCMIKHELHFELVLRYLTYNFIFVKASNNKTGYEYSWEPIFVTSIYYRHTKPDVIWDVELKEKMHYYMERFQAHEISDVWNTCICK